MDRNELFGKMIGALGSGVLRHVEALVEQADAASQKSASPYFGKPLTLVELLGPQIEAWLKKAAKS